MEALAAIDLKKHAKEHSAAYKSGVLVPEMHYRLVLSLDGIIETAGVRPEFVLSSMSEWCSKEELDWVRKLPQYKTNGIAGLVYVGGDFVEERMMAVAGACLRNFIDARLMTVQDVLYRSKERDMPDPSVLLIPNFCVGIGVAEWECQTLLGLLYRRYSKCGLTVVGIDGMDSLAKRYGIPFKKHVEKHYEQV